ncbi:MAG TPA: hypothetical protein VGV60_02105 [Candidatus Polarisedimenticolia bacterium]|nr:hypothetical protein [Candidatus Polarisedimenticolia bacterium]
MLRVRSFNALEQDLRRSRRWEAWVGARKPSADTLGRVVASMSAEKTRQILSAVLHRAWRSKAIHLRPGESYRVVAVDGHEIGASRARCCPQCLVREIPCTTGTVREYYHRFVAAQWVGVLPPVLLDLELIRPGEGEVAAARRLLKRILHQHARLIDVISADALYLEAPFLEPILDAGKHVVIVMKQERRELFQDAEQLKCLVAPQVLVEGPKTTRLWDLSNLSTFTTLRRTVRVVWAEEQTRQRKMVGGSLTDVLEEKTWVWVTDLLAATVLPTKIQRWGHDRWVSKTGGSTSSSPCGTWTTTSSTTPPRSRSSSSPSPSPSPPPTSSMNAISSLPFAATSRAWPWPPAWPMT